MSIIVTGSIATDYLTAFPGRFAEQILPDQLDSLSVSFLVEELAIHRGGAGANIAFNLGCPGLRHGYERLSRRVFSGACRLPGCIPDAW